MLPSMVAPLFLSSEMIYFSVHNSTIVEAMIDLGADFSGAWLGVC